MQEISPSEFDDFINSSLALVQFTAPWCGPCRSIAPHMTAFSSQYGDRMKFGKFNIDHDKRIMQEYGVRGVPTLMIFSDGRPIGRALVGAHTRAEIEKFILSVVGDVGVAETQEAPPPRPVDPRVAAAVPRRIPGWSNRRR